MGLASAVAPGPLAAADWVVLGSQEEEYVVEDCPSWLKNGLGQ
jgi:hypothetical protein